MAELQAFPYECTADDDCDAAYPHPLLRDKHMLDEHPEFADEVDRFIEGENELRL